MEIDQDVLLNAYGRAEDAASEVSRLERVAEGQKWGEEVLLAEGGAKKVFLTQDLTSGRELVKAYPRNESQYDDFIKEARLHSLLEHSSTAFMFRCDLHTLLVICDVIVLLCCYAAQRERRRGVGLCVYDSTNGPRNS